jgi:hypothetical protein
MSNSNLLQDFSLQFINNINQGGKKWSTSANFTHYLIRHVWLSRRI